MDRADMRSVRAVPSAQPSYTDYRPLSTETVAVRIAAYPGIAERLGGEPAGWDVREVGDGNLNFVYIVHGPSGSVCVKQALPYVRLVGESWPLPLNRSFYEHAALVRQAEDAGAVPEVIGFDGGQAIILMENLGRHQVWRRALIDRQRHETAAPILGRFMAQTLFRSSDFALRADAKKREMALFSGNTALCRVTEDLVFTDPYTVHELNDWTAPELDAEAASIRDDTEWKVAVQGLKWLFLTRAEALIHGDLHTGSVMVSPPGPDEDVRIIDPEFAVYGPIGFDIGALLANLWLNAAAQDGPGAAETRAWVVDQGRIVWGAFAARFGELWRTERTGDAWPQHMFGDPEDGLAGVLAQVQEDALGFAGAEMTRRILGLAGVADLTTIEPPGLRAACERRALRLARTLVVERARLATVEAVSALAHEFLEAGR